jgi:hypothetical protein
MGIGEQGKERKGDDPNEIDEDLARAEGEGMSSVPPPEPHPLPEWEHRAEHEGHDEGEAKPPDRR